MNYLTPESFKLLKELKKNNTVLKGRPWYEENKSRYENLVKFPLEKICEEVGEKLRKISPDIYVNPKSNLFRLHRDLRFTPDHRPFKEWAAFRVWLGGRNDRKIRSSFYFHIGINEFFLAAGRWRFTSEQLSTYRGILTNTYQTKKLKEAIKKSTRSNSLFEESLSKIPKRIQETSNFPQGYLYKGMGVYREFSKIPREVYSKEIVNFSLKIWKSMLPIMEWTEENICHPEVE